MQKKLSYPEIGLQKKPKAYYVFFKEAYSVERQFFKHFLHYFSGY